MTASAATVAVRRPNALLAIFWGGLACGVLDITAAFVVYGFFGAKPIRILQSVAAGVLGPQAFGGRWMTVVLGLVLHFVIAFGAAAVYVVASRWIVFLLRHAVVSGALYGVAVYFFMNRVVLPLSAAGQSPFSVKMAVIGVVIHIFCVGLPIALVARRYVRSE